MPPPIPLPSFQRNCETVDGYARQKAVSIALRKKRLGYFTLLLASVGLIWLGARSFTPGTEIAIPFLSSIDIQTDPRSPFDLDPTKVFTIELGRGSGWHGLDVVKIDETGFVELQRVQGGTVETGSLRLSAANITKLTQMVNSRKLTTMGKSYIASRVADGTQWVLWIEQGPNQKSIYFSNTFPAQITAFAADLDALLANAGMTNVTWTPLPAGTGRDHQKQLWDRIR